MTIETKYNIGDDVCFSYARKPVSATVVDINIDVYEGAVSVEYGLSAYFLTINETELFTALDEVPIAACESLRPPNRLVAAI